MTQNGFKIKNMEQESESSKADRNKQARIESFEKIREMVNSGEINYNHVLWLNAINHIIKDLEYRPNPELVKEFNEKAIKPSPKI